MVDENRHKKNEPSDNHVWLSREQVPVKIEIVASERVVATENDGDKEPK